MIMQNVTLGMEPKRVLGFFEQICSIPHGSGNEERIADYLQSFANLRGLYCVRDAKNNVFIRIEATEGYKDAPAVLLQGHTDMVCEKISDSKHDFERDGLDIYIENGYLRAHGTTLGGDDGIAVAMMLALLDGELEEHPAIECLFTVEEETGLGGAEAFDYSRVKARRMINIDSDNELEVVAGCAGGVRTDVSVKHELSSACGTLFEISVDGLFGGHSGVEINAGRTNAIMALVGILKDIRAKTPIRLVSLSGGDKDNAIPRSCRAAFFAEDSSVIEETVNASEAKIREALSDEDKGLKIVLKTAVCEGEAHSAEHTDALLGFLSEIQVGVINMSRELEGLVEFSRNLGVIRISDGKARITYSSRSAKSEQIDLSISQVKEAAERISADISCRGRYPGWDFVSDSPLREAYVKAYKEVIGGDVNTVVIHAGLECGIIKSKLDDMDIISVGPNMYNIHTPDEALDLASVARVFEVIKAVLTA